MKISQNKLSCAICQPHYLPWIGYFEMIDRVQVFVFLDDVKFIKREWKNRNKIRKSAIGADTKWLTVPIAKESQDLFIKDAAIARDKDWVSNHCNSLKEVYSHAPFFDKYFPQIAEMLNKYSEGTLGDLNIALSKYLCGIFGINTRLVKSSELGVQGKREEKLLNICKRLGADYYLANNATAEYVEADYFQSRGIEFATQNYKHPQYIQRYKDKTLPFISHLSIADLLFNAGEDGLKVIVQGRS